MAGARRIGGRYRLVEPLGSGGMSVVWRGFDDVLQRPVAVKVLAGELAADPILREAIRREAQAAARLCHPHIASVFDFGESTVDSEEETPYVVMELVAGESLSTLLAGGARLPWRSAAAICAQVASALSEAHAHGVVHRDVKAGNVMIGWAGAKVVDFGISALVGECELAADGQLLGTPAYVAPERLAGGRAETASDVYAVGVLLYRMLTGRLPFPVATAQELVAAHADAEPPAIDDPDIPAEVVDACRACLSREPEQRPRSEELAAMLGEASGATVQYPSPVLAATGVGTGVGTAGPATAGIAVEELTPLPYTASLPVPPAGPLRAWFARSPARRRVAVVALAVLLLASVAALGGPASPAERRSALGNPPVGPGPADDTAPGCQVHYRVERDWRSGFAAVVTVTNAGAADLTTATLRFRFPGEQRIVTGPRWRQDGRDVSADLALAAGTSVRLPFTARYSAENPLPLRFLVDDVTCDARVTGATNEPGIPPGSAQVEKEHKGKGKGKGKDHSDNSGPG